MRRNPHASPIKEKHVSVFQLQTFSQDSEQCAGFMCVSYHNVRHRRRTLCPHKELQSAFISFYSVPMGRGYESLRTDKRKTARPFFAFRLHDKITEACAMRRNSGRPACDFVRSACGRAFGFASLTSLRRKLAVSTEQLYSLRTVSAVRAAIVYDYEKLYRSRSRR